MSSNRAILTPKRRRLLKIVLLLGPFFALLILETILRCFFPQPARGFPPNLYLTQNGVLTINPAADGYHYAREFCVKVAGNEHGYRKGTWSDSKDENKPSLWLFGDSFAYGWGVEAEQTFAHHLQDNFTVSNFGVPGDNWAEYGYRLRWALSNFDEPEFILITTYDNDFSTGSFRRVSDITVPHAPPEPKSVQERGTLEVLGIFWMYKSTANFRVLLLTSHVIRAGSRFLDSLGISGPIARFFDGETDLVSAYKRHLIVHTLGYQHSSRWELTKEQFEDFFELAKSTKAKIVVVRIKPAFVNGSEWQEKATILANLNAPLDFDRFDRELRSWCEPKEIEYFVFGPESEEDAQAYYFQSDLHLNGNGHESLGRFLVHSVLRN